jgi:microcystin-dependent protein
MKLKSVLLAAVLATAGLAAAPSASAQEPFIGELRLFGNNFCPRNWAKAEGQLLPISSNTALFSLLGTTYGGDGRTTFALPNLTGRAPVGVGTGPGLSTYSWGQRTGGDTRTLSVAQLPSHSHTMRASNNAIDTHDGAGDLFGDFGGFLAYGNNTSAGQMNNNAVTNTGGGQSFSVQQPQIIMNWCVALYGIFPSRS